MRKNRAFDGVIALTAERFGAARAEAARQFHGVLEVANLNLQFLQSKGMQELFSCSTFDLADLKGDKRRHIHLSLPAAALSGYVFRVFPGDHHHGHPAAGAGYPSACERIPGPDADG
jgi:type IV secretory pathway TraG/TraD family ATPase VirD4